MYISQVSTCVGHGLNVEVKNNFAHGHIRPQYDFRGIEEHRCHISHSSLMPENLVFVIKMLTILVEMPKLPERGDYYANHTFTQIKVSDSE